MSDKKEIGFVRKHPLPGVYGICYKKRQIQIKNREIFFTDDNGLIKAFRSDPEISEFKPEPKAKEVVEYSEMSEKDLLKICKGKGLVDDNVDIKNTKKSDLVQILEEHDRVISAPENDQGEQNPK
ncbi:hypothetical protein KAR28_06200 [Candidatus Parcubacteria bacterium]|nr:hypothetical protein [Candidatus Parcubacteria bacterium]